MTATMDREDPPSLRKLAELDRRWTPSDGVSRPMRPTGPVSAMGYQPALDGLRAISVIAVMLFHAGFAWMGGGFFGVEVFFVVSGYLITSLLLDEREKHHRVSLEQFWLRRARRLLPALFTMLVAVAIWAALFGTDEQQSTLKRDLPWSIFYVSNWGQIVGSTPYFASADPPLLRHLWSLAVEEQWYVIWPLVFVAAMTIGAGRLRSRGVFFVSCSLALMVVMHVLHGGVSNNALYLGTITRSSGLLLGAGCAFVWRPWRAPSPSQMRGRRLDPMGAAALALLVCIMSVATLTAAYIYQWLLPVVSLLSMAVIAVVVYPTSYGLRAVLGWRPLVEIGRRSYGLYLWHWPIFVIGHVYHSGSWLKFVVAMAVTAGVAELSFRFVETPIRKGFLGSWLKEQRNAIGVERVRRVRISGVAGTAIAVVLVGLLAFYVSVDHFDAAVGGANAQFSLTPGGSDASTASGAAATPADADPNASTGATATTPAASGATAASGAPATTALGASATPTTLATLPRKVVVVGDSQAHSLAINLPDGIEPTFTITDGSVEGCGVYDAGKVVSARAGFNRSFGDCAGWAGKWGSAAASSGAAVALVVIGAWDVFDLQLADRTLVFGTPEADAFYLSQVQLGIDALKAAGSKIALLEVPCMRPQDVKGAGVPALPERGDDTRTGHLNVLLKQAAATDPAHVTFVPGPTQWCNDPVISSDLGYRWDGVHVYKPGANLIYETIAPTLLTIPI
jgi:peptidoglycan/LPS O-acetylase OafA/YrhL